MPNPIERILPNDPRLPPNLFLSEPDDAEVLPDGRVVPLSLPPAARARHYPELQKPPDQEPGTLFIAPPLAAGIVVLPDLAPVAQKTPADPEPTIVNDISPSTAAVVASPVAEEEQ